MHKALSPTHRDLSHINSKLFQAVALKGTMSKNSSPQKSTLGKWENLISRSETPKTASSSKNASQIQRYNESIQAFRTLNPSLQDEKVKVSCKKMLSSPTKNDKPGNWESIIGKTSTIEDFNKLGKKVFKGKSAESALIQPREKRLVKSHPYKKQNDYSNKIACIPSSNTIYLKERSPSQKKHVSPPPQRLNSTNISYRGNNLNNSLYGPETERPTSPAKLQLAKFLATSIQNEPIVRYISPKRDPNKESYRSYYDDGRLNPSSKGKKLLERALSSERYESVAESMQPINDKTKGKRMLSPRATPTSNWFDLPAEEPMTGRGKSVYSYRTFASQVPL